MLVWNGMHANTRWRAVGQYRNLLHAIADHKGWASQNNIRTPTEPGKNLQQQFREVRNQVERLNQTVYRMRNPTVRKNLEIDVECIRYSQNSISSRFQDERLLGKLIATLKSWTQAAPEMTRHKIKANRDLMIKVCECPVRANIYITADNRRA